MLWFWSFGSSFSEDTQRLGVVVLLLVAVIGIVKGYDALRFQLRRRAMKREYDLMRAAHTSKRSW